MEVLKKYVMIRLGDMMTGGIIVVGGGGGFYSVLIVWRYYEYDTMVT